MSRRDRREIEAQLADMTEEIRDQDQEHEIMSKWYDEDDSDYSESPPEEYEEEELEVLDPYPGEDDEYDPYDRWI